jgi:hypothetical protein
MRWRWRRQSAGLPEMLRASAFHTKRPRALESGLRLGAPLIHPESEMTTSITVISSDNPSLTPKATVKSTLCYMLALVAMTATADPLLPPPSGQLFTQLPQVIRDPSVSFCPVGEAINLCKDERAGTLFSTEYAVSSFVQLDVTTRPAITALGNVSLSQPSNIFIAGGGVSFSYSFMAVGVPAQVLIKMPVEFFFEADVGEHPNGEVTYSSASAVWTVGKQGHVGERVESIGVCNGVVAGCGFGLAYWGDPSFWVQSNQVYNLNITTSFGAATYAIPGGSTAANLRINGAELRVSNSLEVAGYIPVAGDAPPFGSTSSMESASDFLVGSASHSLVLSPGVGNVPIVIPSIPEPNTVWLLLAGVLSLACRHRLLARPS